MEAVDELMGAAQVACESVFGRSVVYTAPAGSPTPCTGIFYQRHERISYQGGAEVSTVMPAVDIRDEELGVVPVQEATVVVAGGTYRVVDVEPRQQRGSHLLILGRRTA